MKNELYNEDCLDAIKKIRSNSVQLIIADPPYFLGMTHNGIKGAFVDLAICKPFFEELFKEFKRVLKENGCIYYFCDWRGYAFYYPIFDNYIGAKNLICWHKGQCGGSYYAFNHELIIFHTSNTNFNNGYSNIWDIKGFAGGAKVTNGKKVHPTQKTIEVITKMIIDGSCEGDLVLDPFAGSGTTAVCCLQQNRKFIGYELNENNFNVATKRISEVQKIFKF